MSTLARQFPLAFKKARAMCVGLPTLAKTSGQRRLQAKHGTPKDFCLECIAALGEISADEMKIAVEKYRKEWEAA